MRPFGLAHGLTLTVIVIFALAICLLCRQQRLSQTAVRYGLASVIGCTELIRYSVEGFKFPYGLPLQLCDLTAWVAVVACVTLTPLAVEILYFAGLGGAGVALLSPDMGRWSWSLSTIHYFVEHGSIIVAASALVFGRLTFLRDGAVVRVLVIGSFSAAFAGVFDMRFGTNYFFLRDRPASLFLLNFLSTRPTYLGALMLMVVIVVWLLWLPARSYREAEEIGRATIAAQAYPIGSRTD